MSLLTIPGHWESKVAPAPGVSMAAWPPVAEDETFAPNLVLTTERVGAEDLRTWQREVDLALPAQLRDYQLLDLQLVQVGGLDGVRRLATYTIEDFRSVTMEQWAVLVKGTGFTVTATSATIDFPTRGTELRAVARTLSPLPAGRRP